MTICIRSAGLPRWLGGKESICQCKTQEAWIPSLGQEDLLEQEWQPTLVCLPGKSMDRVAWLATVHGVKKELDTT